MVFAPQLSHFFLRTALPDPVTLWIGSEGAVPWDKTWLSGWIWFRLPFGNFVLSGCKRSRNWWLKIFLRAKHILGEKHQSKNAFPCGGSGRTHHHFASLTTCLCQSFLPCPGGPGTPPSCPVTTVGQNPAQLKQPLHSTLTFKLPACSTGFHVPPLPADGGREVMAEGCKHCQPWAASL